MTGNVTVSRHFYQVERERKTYTVYQLQSVEGKKELTDFVRVEKFRHYSQGQGFEHYFRLKNTTSWNTSEMVTGLFPTDRHNIFYGDRLCQGKKSFVIFQYVDGGLVIHYYMGFLPPKETVFQFISDQMGIA